MYRKLKSYYKKKKDGFTLIELIVVLVILGIILAVTVPAVTSYIDDANDIKDDVKISYLNKAAESYKVRRYGEGTWKKGNDVFEGIATSKDKQTVLLDKKLIDEYQTSIYDDTDYFTWDVASQRWTRGKGSGGGGSTPPDTNSRDSATILGDPSRGNDRGEWTTKTEYKHGDIVIKDGITYKCIWSYGPIVSDDFGKTNYWKKIVIEFDSKNHYETNDIITYNGEYYKATGFNSSVHFTAFQDAIRGIFNDSVIIEQLFTKVIWDGTAFVNAS